MIGWLHLVPPDANWYITGGSRRGKSFFLIELLRSRITAGLTGETIVDPHGEVAHGTIELLAANRRLRRTLHIVDPNSQYACGINPLRTDGTWEGCHDAANVLASVVESRFDAPPEALPRLSRIIYVAGMLCARHGLTLLELVECLSLGGEALRRSLLQDFDNRIVRRELEDLIVLAERQPARFLETVESAKNRFVRWLGDRRLARMLGQKKGLDPRAVMDKREIVVCDLSSLSYADSAFVGTIITSMYFAAARRRPAMQCARHSLTLDEAESLITVDVARMTSQTSKFGLNVRASVQYLGQVRAKGPVVAEALATNCPVKVAFGGADPEASRYLAELFYAGHLPLNVYKDGTDRPVVVGHDIRMARSSTHGEQIAEHEMVAEGETVTRSRAHTKSRQTARAATTATSTLESEGESLAVMDADSSIAGTTTSEGDTASLSMSPPDTSLLPSSPSVLGQGTAHTSNSAISNARSSVHAVNRGQSASRAQGRSRALTESESEGEAETEGEALSRSRARARGSSRARSYAEGESEMLVPVIEWLPTETFSLEEQLHRAAAAIAGCARREAFVKIEGARPLKIRTPDVRPAFRSRIIKKVFLPLFLKAAASRSPYLRPNTEVDAELDSRIAEILKPASQPTADFSAQPVPGLDDILQAPGEYAAEFWKRQTAAKPRAPKRPAREAQPGEPTLTVIDGGRNGGDNDA